MKLAGKMSSRPISLPGKHLINGSLLGLNAITMGAFVTAAPTIPAIAAAYLGANTVLSFIKGYTTTAAIGGADMRTYFSPDDRRFFLIILTVAVVITVLNAYSGFALVAEGIPTKNRTFVDLNLIIFPRLHA